MGFLEDTYEKYKDFTLPELQQLVRERGGNLRRNKNRRFNLLKLMRLDKDQSVNTEEAAAADQAPADRPCRKERNVRRFGWSHYYTYRTRDLQDMIAQRTGDTDRNKCRLTCVVILMRLDSKRRFRFLDMITEIRIMIYELLLSTYNDEGKLNTHSCFGESTSSTIARPAILRANKKINAEATEFLYHGVVSYLVNSQAPRIVDVKPYAKQFDPLTKRHWARNVTIFLLHYCGMEDRLLADLVLRHLSTGPLKSLKIVMNQKCSIFQKSDTKVIEKIFLPLRGLVPKRNVELVQFGDVLEKAARLAMESPETLVE